MTTIAWDGVTLAADRQCTAGNATFQVCKVSRHDDYLLAYAGDADQGEEMAHWFANGADPDKFPEKQREADRFSPLVAIRPDGWILVYECTPRPIRFPPQRYAIGSGTAYALAAMHCGRSAVEAVEVACVFDPGTGLGIDAVSF
jgi:ATP-dependent protease HslVU (ClpYQ) peptidase subunit